MTIAELQEKLNTFPDKDTVVMLFVVVEKEHKNHVVHDIDGVMSAVIGTNGPNVSWCHDMPVLLKEETQESVLLMARG